MSNEHEILSGVSPLTSRVPQAQTQVDAPPSRPRTASGESDYSIRKDFAPSHANDSKESLDVLQDRIDEKPRLVDFLFRRQTVDLDSIATRKSVYDDPLLARHYWPKATYENLHRFDPKARWTIREEKVCMLQINQSKGEAQRICRPWSVRLIGVLCSGRRLVSRR